MATSRVLCIIKKLLIRFSILHMIAYHTEDVKTKIVIPTIKYNIPFSSWQKSLSETALCFPCTGGGNII